jgi:branched-chain amino acid transport system ATP-binding protein
MPEPLLELRDVRAGYAEAVVLDGVSLTLPASGSLAVLGRNGVGKTTLLLAIMGFVTLARGSIWLNGTDISRLPPHKRAHLGVGWVPQERDIFPSLTVQENLTVAARPGRWDLDAVFALFPRLKERRANMGNQLSGGEQQMLTIARTLMTNPSLLLLDEPLEGLAPIIVEELTAAIGRMAAENIGLVLVEQHAETRADPDRGGRRSRARHHRASGPLAGPAERRCDARPLSRAAVAGAGERLGCPAPRENQFASGRKQPEPGDLE